MSTSSDLPAHLTLSAPTLHLGALQEGPPEGWLWDVRSDVTVRTSGGPLGWAEPVGLAMLSGWALHRRTRDWPLRVDDSLKSPFTWKSGLLAQLAGRPSPPAPKHVFGLSVFPTEHTLVNQIDDLMERLAIPDRATEEAVQQVIEDLCRNVFHHAATNGEGAHVAASFEPKAGRVRIGVADCGRGIAEDMRQHRGAELSDVHAVRMALEPEVSGSGMPDRNRGVGLYVARRLALAARGAFWIRTGRTLVTASSVSFEDSIPSVTEVGTAWKGTALAVTFHTGNIGDYREAMSAIRDEIEGRGPRYAEVQFFQRADDLPGRVRFSVPPDVSKMALDRDRALSLARDQIVPALRAGHEVILDFSDTKVATQAFCHSLVVPLCTDFGPGVLKRIQFVACSSQVSAMVRTGVHFALREHSSEDAG